MSWMMRGSSSSTMSSSSAASDLYRRQDISARYPKRVHFLHSVDGTGELSSTCAMLLVPTGGAPGVDLSLIPI